ncbi:unnamed protein product [Didymodactylos carnosus]|uniref:Uncharacterized protein n=1 Tax=Didymodactylos carnosus TaxID=1234261 RepID=A0A815ZKM3_9BILA|nr:unnamed protein product [Didymodactylos carnosus]CAF4451834.1 unnamed protein product [Didymodactylos carnosus]
MLKAIDPLFREILALMVVIINACMRSDRSSLYPYLRKLVGKDYVKHIKLELVHYLCTLDTGAHAINCADEIKNIQDNQVIISPSVIYDVPQCFLPSSALDFHQMWYRETPRIAINFSKLSVPFTNWLFSHIKDYDIERLSMR